MTVPAGNEHIVLRHRRSMRAKAVKVLTGPDIEAIDR